MDQQPTTKSGASTVIKIIVGLGVTIFAAVCGFLLWLFIVPPKIVADADAGFKRAKQTIDPEQFRGWALEQMKGRTNHDYQPIQESDIPVYIRNLYPNPPSSAAIMGDIISIYWGGGFFAWGFLIDTTDRVRTTKESAGSAPYTSVEWTNGIHYFHEGRRKIQ